MSTYREYACAQCGDPFMGHAKGPQVRYCPDCKPRRRRETYRAYYSRWPVERRRAEWRKQKARRRAALPPGYLYRERKRAALRKALAGRA